MVSYMDNAQAFGKAAEGSVAALLRKAGRKIKMRGYYDRIDMDVDGLHVELKAARPCTNSQLTVSWRFSLHRHGKISQELPDFYLLRLEQVPYTKHAIHLIIPGDTKTKTFSVGINGLLSQDFADNAKMFDRLRDGTLRKITLDKYSRKA